MERPDCQDGSSRWVLKLPRTTSVGVGRKTASQVLKSSVSEGEQQGNL